MSAFVGPLRVALIGFGAIGRVAWREWTAQAPDAVEVVAILVRRPDAVTEPGTRGLVVDDLDALLERAPDLVVECAGHAAVDAHAGRVLQGGTDLLMASVGALADPVREDALLRAARSGGSRLVIPAGAIGAIDWLAAAGRAGLTDVVYRSRKPPAAWRGSAAGSLLDLDRLDRAETFFRGSAREAATGYPKNANVAATVALATLGFDATRVELIADPGSAGNIHEIAATGASGTLQLRIEGRADPDNPRTSVQTAYSIVQGVIGRTATLAL